MHSLTSEIRKNTKLPFLDLIEEVSKEIIKRNYKKIAILSTSKTKNEKLYDKKLPNTKIIYPNEKQQKKVSEIIIKIIHKKYSKKDKNYLNKLIKKLKRKGAEKILLACTDLGNVIKNNPNTLDTTNVLIKSILQES